MPPSSKSTRIYVAGHSGLVGGAVLRALAERGYRNLITRTHKELDLLEQTATEEFFSTERPELVILAAARVGGIGANWDYPFEFVAENLAIELNAITSAFRSGVRRLLFMGSSCIYPRSAPQPLREEYLLTGPLEETNRPYAVAKIAGIELCRSLNREYGAQYLSLMPSNLYGPGDSFDLETSHMLPALIRKFHEAKRAGPGPTGAPSGPPGVTLWGTGAPRREMLYVGDLAEAVCFLIERDDWDEIPDGLLNIGTGEDATIADLASMVAEIVGYEGAVHWDTTKPDGAPRKLLDTSRMTKMGWRPNKNLPIGIRETYEWFLRSRTE